MVTSQLDAFRQHGVEKPESLSGGLFFVRYLCHDSLDRLFDGLPDRFFNRALHILMIEFDIGVFRGHLLDDSFHHRAHGREIFGNALRYSPWQL